MKSALPVVLAALCLSFIAGCSGSSSSGGGITPTPPPTPSTANEWTWESGSSGLPAVGVGQSGVYGTLGAASATNVPGGRYFSVSWTDSSDNLWLFGGGGIDSSGTFGILNDLWEFKPTTKEWTWVGGSDTANASGVYKTQGTASSSNVPGAHDGSVSWVDDAGNLWLFGGYGYDSIGTKGLLNDLWEFNPTTKEWTWVGGSDTVDASGVYGKQGTASGSNVPGARDESVSWVDDAGNLWLFGGYGYDSTGTEGFLNDLWEFNPTTKAWTWVSGADTAGATGVYGKQGTASGSNIPGSRIGSVGWLDKSGNFWLFGGMGFNRAMHNDLWEFNPTTKEWTWVSGADTTGATGVYGTLGTAATGNIPGARLASVGWIDSSGNFWIFGGQIYNQSSGTFAQMNDFWKFNPDTKEWTWVSGSDTAGATGVYGTLGTAATGNVPGARLASASWIDNSGNFWLFGGNGNYTSGNVTTVVYYNDLWKYQPQ